MASQDEPIHVRPRAVDGNGEAELPLSSAILATGGNVKIRVHDDDGATEVILTVRPQTQAGTKLRMRGCGPRQADGHRNDLFLLLQSRIAPAASPPEKPKPVTDTKAEGFFTGLFIWSVAAGTAVLLGGIPYLGAVSSGEVWFKATVAGLMVMLALIAVSFVTDLLLKPLLKVVPESRMASHAAMALVGFSFAAGIGALLAPTWAFLLHGRELRSQPFEYVVARLPAEIVSRLNVVPSAAALPAHTWDDGLLAGTVANDAVQIRSYGQEPHRDGTTVRFKVHNGTNGRLQQMTVQVGLVGTAALPGIVFRAEEPLLPGHEGEMAAVIPRRLPAQIPAGALTTRVQDTVLLPFDRKAEFNQGIASWLIDEDSK